MTRSSTLRPVVALAAALATALMAWPAAAENSLTIAAARTEWCRLTQALIAETGGGPFPSAGLALDGVLEARIGTEPAGRTEDFYRGELEAGRPRDAAAGRTLTGPHRADLKVAFAARGVPAADCSTGEQKAVLISLVLSQAHLAARQSGASPVVLLDVVAAHLDKGRRTALFEVLEGLGCQTFMTGTDMEVFGVFEHRAERFSVADAAVQPA